MHTHDRCNSTWWSDSFGYRPSSAVDSLMIWGAIICGGMIALALIAFATYDD
jgi:hypothetical protein